MNKKLDASIPANNWKIIELFNKLKKDELDPNPSYQRKLVWKKAHKFKFIETILLNYPFPEIYIAPGIINTDTLDIRDIIVDGQQRSTTIKNYIEGTNVFAQSRIPIKKFNELTKEEKEDFLSYEVSVRYLKNATSDQIKEIFQRINSTEYSLNNTEKLNAQWGESEFICFAKQIIEEDLDLDMDAVNYKVDPKNRGFILSFFHSKYEIFTENDVNRMLALQYILTLLTTLIEEHYFRRNENVQRHIQEYNEEFAGAGELENTLVKTLEFVDSLQFEKSSYWFNKANIFTLIVELYKIDTDFVDGDEFGGKLNEIELHARKYALLKSEDKQIDTDEISTEEQTYFDYAREAVNELPVREYRGAFIRKIIESCMII